MFALNVSGDPGVNLLAITITVVCLLLLKGQYGRVYKVTFIDVIEMVSYANLFVFSAVRLKFGTDQIVSITAHISGLIMLVLLIVTILYHMYITFCSKCLKRCQLPSERNLNNTKPLNDAAIDTPSIEDSNYPSEPTFSVVELKQPGGDDRQHLEASEGSHCQVSRVTSKANDDSISMDSTSALLN